VDRSVETLLKGDGATLTLDRLPEGKFKVQSGTSSVETVIKADEVLEVRYHGGMRHVPAGAADRRQRGPSVNEEGRVGLRRAGRRFRSLTSDCNDVAGTGNDVRQPARPLQRRCTRYRGGMLHVLRRPRIDDPEDLPSSIKDTWGWEERNDVTAQDDVRRRK